MPATALRDTGPLRSLRKALSAGHDDGGGGLCKDRRIGGACSVAYQGQLVGGIVGGNLIALGQCRVIEYGLEKIVESAAQREHGLSNMNKFGGAAADAMTTQQPSVFTVKKHF